MSVISASAICAAPNADVSMSEGMSASEWHYQEWGYTTSPNEFLTCIAYYALEDNRFTKAPSFTTTGDANRVGWSTYISPDRTAVYIFGPRSHFGPNPGDEYTITYIVYYDESPTSHDTVVWDGAVQTSAWSRAGTPGNGGAGNWSYSPDLQGGPYDPISTNWCSFGISGTVNSPPGGAFVGQIMQVGPDIFGDYPGDWGTVSSYSASPAMPQVSGDLHKYGWGMYGVIEFFDPASRTHVSMGDWQIYYKDITDWPVEEGTYLIKTSWIDGWNEPAMVTGTFRAQPGSTVESPPWPVSYTDWSTIGVANFEGTFTNPDQLTGSFSASDNKLKLAEANDREMIFVQFGKPVDLSLHQEQMAKPAVGYQAFISFDEDMLTFGSGTYTPAPYGMSILSIVNNSGKIDLAAGINRMISQPPYAGSAKLADLSFVSNTTEGITQIVFREHDPISRFSDIDGQAITTQTVDGPIIVVDNTPPTDLVVTAMPPTWTNGPVILTFSANDALSGIDRFELDMGVGDTFTITSPHPMDVSLLSTGMHEATIIAYDRAGNSTSTTFTFWVASSPPYIDSISEAKEMDDDSYLELAGPIVTRVYEDFFYIQDYGRGSGIRVNCDPEQLPAEGSTPLLSGTIQTIDGERVIVLDSIAGFGPALGVPGALGMNTRATRIGLSPIGLFVKLAGRVTSISPTEGIFVICDGAEQDLQVKLYGVSLPPMDAFVAVTGALGSDLSGPVMRVKYEDDLQILSL